MAAEPNPLRSGRGEKMTWPGVSQIFAILRVKEKEDHMHTLRSLAVTVVTTVAFASTTAMAQEPPPPAANAYLTIAGIPGESVAVPGAIDIQQYSFNTISQGPRSLFGDFTFSATVSKASPEVFAQAAPF
jgi:hypothetical protein